MLGVGGELREIETAQSGIRLGILAERLAFAPLLLGLQRGGERFASEPDAAQLSPARAFLRGERLHFTELTRSGVANLLQLFHCHRIFYPFLDGQRLKIQRGFAILAQGFARIALRLGYARSGVGNARGLDAAGVQFIHTLAGGGVHGLSFAQHFVGAEHAGELHDARMINLRSDPLLLPLVKLRGDARAASLLELHLVNLLLRLLRALGVLRVEHLENLIGLDGFARKRLIILAATGLLLISAADAEARLRHEVVALARRGGVVVETRLAITVGQLFVSADGLVETIGITEPAGRALLVSFADFQLGFDGVVRIRRVGDDLLVKFSGAAHRVAHRQVKAAELEPQRLRTPAIPLTI